MPNLYSTSAKIKNRLAIPDTLDDAAILAALETVSREIDRYCGRRFYVEQRTRYYGAPSGGCLRVDDLLAVTTLKTDPNGARTYPDSWATTDYDLDPPNAPLESPPEPYTRIHLVPLGTYRFPSGGRSIQITGKWGYYEVLETVGSLLNEALDASETGVDVVDGVLYDIGETLLIDSEQLYVSAIASNTLTVTRGVNGTTAASHLTAAPIQRYTYPVVGEACTQQAILAFQRFTASVDDIGPNSSASSPLINAGLHPFVKNMLDTFRRLEQG